MYLAASPHMPRRGKLKSPKLYYYIMSAEMLPEKSFWGGVDLGFH